MNGLLAFLMSAVVFTLLAVGLLGIIGLVIDTTARWWLGRP